MTTLFLDASALLALHLESTHRHIVVDALDNSSTWCASALALGESLAAVSRLTEDPVIRRELEDNIRHTWDFLHVVPVDQRCLDDAVELTGTQPVSMSTAVHLSAATRLPRPVAFATFDAAHIPVALSLGLEVVSG